VRELAAVLQAELDVVRELVAVCRQEQDALVAANIAAIQAATGRKGELARRLAALEEERQRVIAEQSEDGRGPCGGSAAGEGHGSGLAMEEGLPGGLAVGEGLTVPRAEGSGGSRPALAGLVGLPEERAEIEKMRGLLRQAVRELREVNETNRLLARQSLAYAQKMLALLIPEGATVATIERLV
jgi:flagellar biosynthesis/type III secretory pathway chaperone